MHPPTITSATNDDEENKEKDLAADGPTIERAEELKQSTVNRNDTSYGFGDTTQITNLDNLEDGVASDLYNDEQRKRLIDNQYSNTPEGIANARKMMEEIGVDSEVASEDDLVKTDETEGVVVQNNKDGKTPVVEQGLADSDMDDGVVYNYKPADEQEIASGGKAEASQDTVAIDENILSERYKGFTSEQLQARRDELNSQDELTPGDIDEIKQLNAKIDGTDKEKGEQQAQAVVELKPEGIKRKIFKERSEEMSAISTNKTESGIIEEDLVSTRAEVVSGDTIKKTLQRTYGKRAEDIFKTLQGMNQTELADMGFVDGDLGKIRAGEYLNLSEAFNKMNEASQTEDDQTMIADNETAKSKGESPTPIAEAKIPDMPNQSENVVKTNINKGDLYGEGDIDMGDNPTVAEMANSVATSAQELLAKVTDNNINTEELVGDLKDNNGEIDEELVDYMTNLQQKFEDALGGTGDVVIDGMAYTQEALETGINNLGNLLAFTKKEAPTYNPSKKGQYQTLGSSKPKETPKIYGSEDEEYL